MIHTQHGSSHRTAACSPRSYDQSYDFTLLLCQAYDPLGDTAEGKVDGTTRRLQRRRGRDVGGDDAQWLASELQWLIATGSYGTGTGTA